jgi:hypothetical protein
MCSIIRIIENRSIHGAKCPHSCNAEKYIWHNFPMPEGLEERIRLWIPWILFWKCYFPNFYYLKTIECHFGPWHKWFPDLWWVRTPVDAQVLDMSLFHIVSLKYSVESLVWNTVKTPDQRQDFCFYIITMLKLPFYWTYYLSYQKNGNLVESKNVSL